MIAKVMVVVSALVMVACGEQSVVLGPGQATIENAAAAVVVLEGDRSAADEQVRAIQMPGEDDERPFPANLRSSAVFTEGEPSGRFYVQLIFQTVATTEDRQEIAARVAALGLDDPIWLGPEDRWPFCREQLCDLVNEDGDFPN